MLAVVKLFPGTVLEFERWFRSEALCRKYLARLRWPKGFRCPDCGHGQAWQTRRGLFHCRSCRKNVSVTAGTIFHASHISLRIWFRAVWWVTNQKSGISALGLQRALGLGSYKTAWACLHKLRRAMVRSGRERLSGMVEVDETIIGGRRKRPKKRLEGKSLVVIAAEARGKGTGRIRIEPIKKGDRKTIREFVKRSIEPGSELITDGYGGYRDIDMHGYTHSPEILNRMGREGSSIVLPRVHRVASLLKRWLLGIHQGRVSLDQLRYYLDEFVFRFNRRTSSKRGMLFYRLLQQAVAVDPVPFNQVVANPRSKR